MRTRVEAASVIRQSAPTQEWKGIGSSHACVYSGAHGYVAPSGEVRTQATETGIQYDFGHLPSQAESRDVTHAESGWNRNSFLQTQSGILGNRLPLQASIRVDSSSEAQSAIRFVRLSPMNDSMPGEEETETIDFLALASEPESGEQTAAITEPAEGQTVQLPDVKIPALEQDSMEDGIAGALTYNGSITRSGSLPSPFGITRGRKFSLSGVSVTRSAGNFVVKATVDNPITFQVNGGSRTDIESENDPHITEGNYLKVASDLTPNISDLNGRPPREEFWAEDLTLRHEGFHAQERLKFGGQGVKSAQTWLNGSSAANIGGVRSLVRTIPARVLSTVSQAMTFPGKEQRAYSDGAPLYRARADAIKQKGDAKGYPPAAESGLSRGAKVGIGLGVGTALGAGIGALAGGGVGAIVGAGVGLAAGLVGGLLA